MTIDQAYAECRAIARREAKNFYYAFLALPKHKSDAMCAVYAFMRKADDLADDETMFLQERRDAMALWLTAWRVARRDGETGDPVFIALNDSQRRFNIPDELLEQLVQGTTMDLYPGGDATASTLQTYATFDELYRYCYLVASVVGLVCIRIFGYKDSRAEKLAEETGIAFQLTNILRDVKEDVERGRIYIPREMMVRFNVSMDRIEALAGGAPIERNERAMILALSERAWEYYAAAEKLAPMINRDSRAAFEVLVEIYSGLLKRIDARAGDVFSERASVPTAVKLGILARGMVKSLVNRMLP
ncbi:MAG TPA: phytoene/squalene synthase family protein [Acidobacteriaceae bacterium]|nr:phytoene/squalene synthase family protein [Acidobacteriaceae bacterium]